MSEKVLSEFATRLSRAKNLLETTKSQCDILKREAFCLEKDYQRVHHERLAAEQMEQELRNNYLKAKKHIEEEKANNRKDHEELMKLRELKWQLQIEKDVRETELIKNSVYLQDLIKERTQLEAKAQSLSENLESVAAERQALEEENDYNKNQIAEYQNEIKDLKDEMTIMKSMISKSFPGKKKRKVKVKKVKK